jgi:arginine deiminase
MASLPFVGQAAQLWSSSAGANTRPGASKTAAVAELMGWKSAHHRNGGDSFEAEREQWNDGSNVFEPGVVAVYELIRRSSPSQG